MKISGGHALMQSLIAEGVTTVFGYPGGAIMPVYDAMYDYRDKLRHVLVRHEQGASHAAEGWARACGEVGVCIATSGPGATNLVTGIADAMLDSVPLVCITGQVGAKFLGTDAFQETDVIGITMPITKWNYQVTRAEEIPGIIAKAFRIARSGRPGPVVVDITKNAQIELLEFSYTPEKCEETLAPHAEQLAKAAKVIQNAEKPLLLVGHGVLISKGSAALKAFVEKTGIPIASTLLGMSCFPTSHPLYVGMLGMHGNYGPNILTNKADVIIAVGMRFDDRVTGDLGTYAKQAKIVHIDIDAAEIGKNTKVTAPVLADARKALEALLPLVEKKDYSAWFEEFRSCDAQEYEKVIRGQFNRESEELGMAEVVRLLSERTDGKACVVADVGQHQMMAARYYRFQEADSFICSGGLGTMGYALPAALGAKMARPEREVVAIIGDGGFQMTLQEMGTIAQEKVAVKTIILNNNYLGMVRQWQELFFESRYSFVHLENPNFVMLSEAFGVPAERISTRDELLPAMERMLQARGPYLLEIVVQNEENVFPMVAAGTGVSDIRLE